MSEMEALEKTVATRDEQLNQQQRRVQEMQDLEGKALQRVQVREQRVQVREQQLQQKEEHLRAASEV
jgi:hypothetical protein